MNSLTIPLLTQINEAGYYLSAFLIVAFCFLSISTHTLVRLLKPRLEQHNVFFLESAANGTFSGLLLFNVALFRALCLGILLMFFWVLRRRFYQDFAQLIWGDLLIDKFTQPNKSHNYEASLEISSKSRFFNSSSSLPFRMSLLSFKYFQNTLYELSFHTNEWNFFLDGNAIRYLVLYFICMVFSNFEIVQWIDYHRSYCCCMVPDKKLIMSSA